MKGLMAQQISPLRLKNARLAVMRHQKSALFVPAVEVWQPHVAQDARLMALLRGRAGIPTGMTVLALGRLRLTFFPFTALWRTVDGLGAAQSSGHAR